MFELELKQENHIKIIKVKSWDFPHGFIDKSLDFKLDNKAWKSFSSTELLLLNQVHGKEIIEFKNDACRAGDGWISSLDKLSSENLSLGIKTADCSPVIVFGQSKKLIAVLHCGWRSAYAGILKDCIKKFLEQGEKNSEIEIAIGPAAQGESYEIGLDLVEKLESNLESSLESSNAIKKIVEGEKAGKYFLSISDYLTSQANTLGVKRIISSDICTMKNENYFSHRRQGLKSGRQLTFVG